MKGFDAIDGISPEIRENAKVIKKNLRVTDYEAFSLALTVEKNIILKQAFVISSNDDHPSALEKIAMLLQDKQ